MSFKLLPICYKILSTETNGKTHTDLKRSSSKPQYFLLINYFKCHQYTSPVSKTSQKTTLSRRVAFIPRGYRAEMPGPALALKNLVAQLQQQPHPTICFSLCQEITRIRALSSQEEYT